MSTSVLIETGPWADMVRSDRARLLLRIADATSESASRLVP